MKSQVQKKTQESGLAFSLIELLVVTEIIAILAVSARVKTGSTAQP
jgi:type II secretory pathway pseudopilin PulG